MARGRSADEGWKIAEYFPFGQPSMAKRKAARPRMDWEDVIKKNLKEKGTSLESLRREALNMLGWRGSIRSCVGLR